MRPHPRDAFSIEHGMEQTSMTNAIKKRLDRKGFTLAEVLVTVAIILILAGVTFVSVVQYQKNLRLMEMDGTAKEIFIAAQNHLSVAQASGDLDRLAEKAKSATGTTDSTIGTKLSSAPSYAGNASGEYYYVIHDVNSGSESYTPAGSDAILQMMLPFGALDETVATGGNYAIVYELKSASVVAVLYSGAGNASFGNAAVINFGDDDVSKIKDICNDKSARKNYVKNGVTAIVGCYTGKAGSAAIPTETLEAPKLEVKNENKLHVIVSDKKSTDTVTLIIRGVQSGTVAQRILQRSTSDGHTGTGTFDVTLDDITGDDGSYRFANIISPDRFTATPGTAFIPGENIEISARVSSTTGLATPKESAKYTVSSLFGDVNETKDAGNTTVYIKNLRHLENLGANVSGFTAALGKDATSGNAKVVNITAEQKNDITMFSMSTSGSAGGNHFENLRGSKIYRMEQEATFAAIDVNYPLVYHGNQHEIHDVSIGAQQDHTAAGIFGQVADPTSGAANTSLSVSDLILRNNCVSGTNIRNAGMLVGETTKNLTVDGVLAYYHEDTYDETKDSSVEVTASENAGGLIGLVTGGKLDVKNSAAAVYVKGGNAAGGLIGNVTGAETGSTIVQSYAGGHTKNGAYDTEVKGSALKNQGAGRYNVQASGNAGGFIGVTTNQVQMDNVYATTSVYSSSYSDSNKCSGSFAGTGTLIIPAKPEKDGSTKKHYYALGPHNGVDATKEELACAELAQGQAHRQATPYDRKLVLKNDEKAHQKMDKTSYPLCTVRNLCEEDASVKDADLPWFIKEHVGDWVEQSNLVPKFDVENGNRLTLRIDTGILKKQITATEENKNIHVEKKYGIKVHGILSNQDEYFLITLDSNSVFSDSENKANVVTSATVKRGNPYNKTLWADFNPVDIANGLVEVDDSDDQGNLGLSLYLDDITRKCGHFKDVCPQLYPGEDITIKVACVIDETAGNIVNFQDSNIKEKKTNSLFGSLEQVKESDSSKWSNNDRHNIQKINVLATYHDVEAYKPPKKSNDTNGLKDVEALGLVPASEAGKYYVQIDNSRHLENLSPDVSNYPWVNNNPLSGCFIGAIQTDDIYWSGISTAYTKGFREELGKDLTVWGKENTIKTQYGRFSPLDYNQSVQLYDGGEKCIYGLNVEESGYASLFIQPNSDLIIKYLSVSDSTFISSGSLAGGLVGYTGSKLTLNHILFNNVKVEGNGSTGGFVGQANSELTISNSGINSGQIESKSGHAGGIAGHTMDKANIENTTFDGALSVCGANSSGGIIGNANGKATVDQVTFESDVMVKATSANVHAGGIVGYANGEAEIKNTTFNGCLTVSGENSSAGIIGNAGAKATVNVANFQSDVTVTSNKEHAAGVLGITNNEADIKNVTFSGKLNVCGKNSSGGILGSTGSKLKLWNISIGGPSTITSDPGNAGGIVGYAQSYDADIKNVKFIGKDTEVIAKQNAGGLCGTLTGNSILNISNVAVSAFIQAEENAGGLIGQLNTEANEGKLKNSYYGGRTYYGQYGSITINHNEKPYTYTANIHGNQAAGGLIGYIQNANGLTISQCFSTGSVENSSNNQTAGGFIGVATPWSSGVKITNCYSMGNVSGTNNGGFIGNKNEKVIFDEGVYYLKVFNETIPAIGTTSTGDNSTLIVLDLVDAIKGTKDSKDLSEETMPYDETLNEKVYPYKNWTTNWESKETSKPIAYYGDWPSPKPLTGEFIYFHAVNTSSFNKNGDTFKLTGEKTNAECFLKPANDNMELEKIGFGIISDVVIQDDASYGVINTLYSWSLNPNGPFDGEDHYCKTAGSVTDIKYSEFNYFGKKYYYYRCTAEPLKKKENGVVYVRDNTTKVIYKISVVNGNATFERI